MEDNSDAPGASAPKRGRPSVKTAHIRLRMEVFQEWNTKKEQMGYSNKTHSEFAEILLQSCVKRSVATTQTSQTALTDEMPPTDTGCPTPNTGTFTVYLYYIRMVNCLHEKAAISIL